MEKHLNIHRNTASTYLNLLEKKWLLKSKKVKRNKIFYFKEFLETLE
jgi:predicted transcriptional regulator